jgi:glycosyltransferase involved in cell wall biosynthesis
MRRGLVVSRVTVDCGNLHGGGGVQVACSFLDEIAQLIKDSDHAAVAMSRQLNVLVSTDVLQGLGQETIERLHPILRDIHGFKGILHPSTRASDVTFVLFGPDYVLRRTRRRVVGFADGTTVLPGREKALPGMSVSRRIRARIRALIAARLFRSADVLVVESRRVQEAVAAELGYPADNVKVVPNALNGVFGDESRWAALPIPTLETPAGATRLCYVCQLHPHKNLAFLGKLGQRLLDDCGIRVQFVLTLSAKEWRQLPGLTQHFSATVGRLSITQVPRLYRECDGAIFPSLLEGFSIAPLEALAMERILFASDRPFVRDVCGDAPIYIDPLDPGTSARTVAAAIRNPLLQADHVRAGLRVVGQLPTARDRARAYLEILRGNADELGYEKTQMPLRSRR